MSEIASFIKAYMKKNGVSLSEVKSKLEEFQKSFRNDNTNNLATIFEFNEDTNLSEDEFKQIIISASSTGLSEFSEEDIQMFLDLADINDDGNFSADELGQFAYSNVISSQSIWNGILCGEVTESDVTDLESDSGDDNDTTTGSADTDTKVDENDDGDIEDTENTNLDKIRKQIDDVLSLGGRFKTPEDVISFLFDEGKITEDEAKLLRAEYAQYNDEDEATIESYQMLLGLSKQEAIEKAEEDGVLTGDPIVSTSTEEIHDLNEMAIDSICSDLSDSLDFWFGNGKKAEEIFQDDSLTPNDWVNILDSFKKTNDKNLIRVIDDLYLGDFGLKDMYTDILVDNLLEAAKNGNEKAYQVLADCLYDGMEGTGTFDPFYQSFFEKIDNETLYKVIQNFNGGVSKLKKMIRDDFSGKTENNYINKIDEAVNEFSS